MLVDGRQSSPSQPSEVVLLNNLQGHYVELDNVKPHTGHGQVPEKTAPPEYLDFDGGNSVTLCWLPAKSVLPVLVSLLKRIVVVIV